MNNFAIDDYLSLRLHVYVIGYSDQGESIVVLFTDKMDNVYYTIVIDSYAKADLNKTVEILQYHKISHIDLLCWSHPDKDHTIGIDKLISEFCNDESFILVPFGLEGNDNDFVNYNRDDKEIITRIFNLNSSRHKAFKVVGCNEDGFSQVTGFNFSQLLEDPLPVRIFALSPHMEYIQDAKLRRQKGMNTNHIHKNDYSISLCLKIADDYYFHYCSDIENRTINHIYPDFFSKATFVKIPHHSSKGSDKLLQLLPNKDLISCTTIYAANNLPNDEILAQYKKRSKTLHSTGASRINSDFGMIEYNFDLFDKHSVDVKLYGLAKQV